MENNLETIKSVVDQLNAQKNRADFRKALEEIFFKEWPTRYACDEYGWNPKFIRDIGSLLWYIKHESFD